PDRPTQSISVEDTFERDVQLSETEPMIRRLAFKILTRSYTSGNPPSSCDELTDIALKLRERVGLNPQQRYRLVGVGLSNFREAQETESQPALFE
ncbi:MAG: DNA-directed polymerase, partial [Acidobacteriaceae bacterium]|nr:DNA-directed polymerase [Acidobacteriaceae bacterium]